MGLDSVEILMKVEDNFGIKIPNRDAEKVLTVGDFHDVVWKQLSGKQNTRCKSQAIFYKLRSSAAERFSIPSKEFLLESSPVDLIPRANRRMNYYALSDLAGLQFPPLALTRPAISILNVFGWITIGGGLAASIILINFFSYSYWTLIFPFIGIRLTMLLLELLESKRLEIPFPTLRAFTNSVLTLNYSRLKAEQGINRAETEMIINQIISDQSGIELEEITPDKKIGDDLGID